MKFVKTSIGNYVNMEYIIAIEVEIKKEKYDTETGDWIPEERPHAYIWLITEPKKYIYKRIEIRADESQEEIDKRVQREITNWEKI